MGKWGDPLMVEPGKKSSPPPLISSTPDQCKPWLRAEQKSWRAIEFFQK